MRAKRRNVSERVNAILNSPIQKTLHLLNRERATIIKIKKKAEKYDEKTVLRALKETLIPVSIFSSKQSPLEALVVYLKDKKKLTYHEIGEFLGRNERNVWHSYRKGKKKGPIQINDSYFIPLSLFKNRNLSILEHVVNFLAKNNAKNIAKLLKKDPSTIWAVQSRIKKKQPRIDDYYFNKVFQQISELKEDVQRLEKLGLSPEDVLALDTSEILLAPLSIFRTKLSPLEALVKYLVENKSLRLSEAATALNRDQRTVWVTYKNARQKLPRRLGKGRDILIPVSILTNRRMSVLENLVLWLKEQLKLRYCEIAILLKLDQRTVWTVYSRADRKLKNE
ncbi:hypothetical protein D6745_00910 [Candidatus Woesearchaeota archaeon]|nr:MAG: hypothetical protein D6745_00910 [Candidatus Woesearchaeota archaeon]